jgi:hypothetical protein
MTSQGCLWYGLDTRHSPLWIIISKLSAAPNRGAVSEPPIREGCVYGAAGKSSRNVVMRDVR